MTKRERSDKIAMKVLRECIKRGKELNAFGGGKGSYENVSHAKGLYELSAHQLALFAPQLLKMLRRKARQQPNAASGARRRGK